MKPLPDAVDDVLKAHQKSGKPLAVIVAGHNGSGKSTLWYERLAPTLELPLINADRMILSILPERDHLGRLPDWARRLRDTDESWMKVAQKGVEAFVVQAIAGQVAFAMETVFSYWSEKKGAATKSKIDLIRELQSAGYFVLLAFVGLSDVQLSIGRVQTRISEGGHAVDHNKLVQRFPRTQKAIAVAANVSDATLMLDNSRGTKNAFTVCRIQLKEEVAFDIRSNQRVPAEISAWLDIVSPRPVLI